MKVRTQQFEASGELPARNRKQRRQGLGTIGRERLKHLCVQRTEDMSEELALQLNYILWPVDKTELHIQRVVFGQMPARGVRLGSVHMAGFVDTLEPGNPVLLVKLGALRQVRHTIEILEFKQVRPAFGSRGH